MIGCAPLLPLLRLTVAAAALQELCCLQLCSKRSVSIGCCACCGGALRFSGWRRRRRQAAPLLPQVLDPIVQHNLSCSIARLGWVVAQAGIIGAGAGKPLPAPGKPTWSKHALQLPRQSAEDVP